MATRLLADGVAVVDVPAKPAAWVRALSTGHGRKTDEADAVSVAVAAWKATALVSVQIDETALELRALTEHRDDLVKTRTQTVNRLHVLLAHLIPGGARTRRALIRPPTCCARSGHVMSSGPPDGG